MGDATLLLRVPHAPSSAAENWIWSGGWSPAWTLFLMTNTPPQLLRLHSADNVLTVIATMEPNELLEIDGLQVSVVNRLPIGHKVAARSIGVGEKIIKYGVPIGSATAEIAIGEHVHTHNLKSDYLPTFERETQSRFFEEKI
jgi:altronate dehydratase small subunit